MKIAKHFFVAIYFFIFSISAGLEPASAQNRRVTVEGTLEKIVVEDNPSRYEYVLATDEGRRYLLSASKSPADYANRRVIVSGTLEGDRLLVPAGEQIKAMDEDRRPVNAPPAPTFGSRKVLALLVNFQDIQTQPITTERAREVIFTAADSANQFVREASLNRYRLTGIQRADGDVAGWLTLPFTSQNCNRLTDWVDGADALARQNGYEPNNYNSVIYVFSTLCGDSPRATLGNVGDATTRQRIWITPGTLQNFHTLNHELGHNLGLDHANSMRCSGTNIPDDCIQTEYGDSYDMMGTLPFFFNNYYRLSLGWLTGRVQDVETSGDYSLFSPNIASKGNQALRIPLRNAADELTPFSYFLEFRRAYSYDNQIRAPNFQPLYKGVGIRYVFSEPLGFTSQIIDTMPNTITTADAPLTAGNTFVDTKHGVIISVLSTNPLLGARVRIQLNR
ncbi:MAG: DUF5818 domain-containing protein [Acidobacteriota bacterium]|nr:DUF5818 domain-containing protein [Acidobacteriota bacterium]